MALRMYHDSGTSQEITQQNPDRIDKSVQVGQDVEDVRRIYIKSDDGTLSYEQVAVTSQGTSGNITVKYALDVDGNPGPWHDSLDLPDADYAGSYPIWRQVKVTNVQNAIWRTDIFHRLDFDEFVIL